MDVGDCSPAVRGMLSYGRTEFGLDWIGFIIDGLNIDVREILEFWIGLDVDVREI